jgi:hypothetical protein
MRLSTMHIPAQKKQIEPLFKKVNTIYQTSDYSMLIETEENRDLNPKVVKALKASFAEKYIQNPIIVNEAFQIIDGHNRKAAAQELGLPVYFVIVAGLTKDDIIRLNVNRTNWTTDDYLKFYINEGLEDYRLLLRFRDTYKFSLADCLGMLTGLNSKANNEHMRKMHAGKFKVKSYGRAVEMAENILKVKPYYNGVARRSFVGAMLSLFNNTNYKHNEFLEKLSYQQTRLVDCATTSQYVELIEQIYNYKRRGNLINLRF